MLDSISLDSFDEISEQHLLNSCTIEIIVKFDKTNKTSLTLICNLEIYTSFWGNGGSGNVL